MTTPASLPKIAVIVGSNRRDSINRKLAQALVRLAGGKLVEWSALDHRCLQTNGPYRKRLPAGLPAGALTSYAATRCSWRATNTEN